MRINYFRQFGIILLFAIAASPLFAQLSGKYTIDPTATASSTNYQNWASAISDLRSGTRTDGGTAQGSGVSGPVVFTVYDTVYSEQLLIASITGTSYTNTITFKSKGGDSSACVLKVTSGTVAGQDYVVGFSGSSYITFHQIGMLRTGSNTYSSVIQLSNNADRITISNCWLKGRKVPSNSSNGFQYGIGSVVHITGNADSLLLLNNKMIYGYNGIYTTQSCSDIRIVGNSIDTSGSSGAYMTNQTRLQITGNTFSMGDFGPSTGHYTSYGCRIESSPGMLINKNKIYMLATNGQVVRAVILANTTSSKSNPTRVNNNWIMNGGGTGDCTGLAVYNCRWVDFYYNNILITNSLKSGSAYYHYANYTNRHISLVNNILANVGGGFVYNVPGTNTADLMKIDYNDCYTNGSKFGKWSGTDYSSFAAWKSGSRNDTSSVNVDPGFNSYSDQHVSNIKLNGKATPYAAVTDDIDGDKRSTTSPDIGADEFFPATVDAGVSNLDSPAAFCAGLSTVKVAFQNYGIDTLTSVELNWSVNGTSQKAVSWTGKVAPGSADTIKIGSYTFASNTTYTFKIWTAKPNNKTDGKTVNDTLTITKQPGLTGTYSIGQGSGYDYGSFNDAITAITARGLCGPTTFNVADGVYKEQITLVQLDGMSAANTLTFQSSSKDSSKVIITLPSTTATGNNNAVVQLRGADYVRFKGMTFRRTGTNTYAQVIHILNGSHKNTFEHCRMLGTRVTGSNANGVNIWSNIGTDTANIFRNNLIKHGTYNIEYHGTSLASEKGTIIEGNTFDSAYNSAVLISYNNGITLRNNTFNNIRNATTGNFDLALRNCDGGLYIGENLFYDRNTDYSISYESCATTKSKPAITANNFFAKNNGTAIYIDGITNHYVAFNSFRLRGTSTSNVAIATTTSTSSGISLLNNNISMAAGKAFQIESASHVSESNYNNFDITGKPFAYWDGNDYNNFSSFRNASKQDSASFNSRAGFVSRFNLHTSNSYLNGTGIAVPGVSIDIDGETRGNRPDIGADEFDPLPNDAGVADLADPNENACAGVISVKTVLTNYGSNELKTASINWAINGTAQTSYSWTGSLKTGESDTVTLGTYSFTGNIQYNIKVNTSSPNSSTDAFGGNDSASFNRLINPKPPTYAGKDKDICIGDSVLIGSAGQAGYVYSWRELGTTTEIGDKAKIYVQPTVGSEYILSVERKTTGCTDADTIAVGVNMLPVINAGNDTSICDGQRIQIGSSAQTGHSYEWTSQPAGFTSSQADPHIQPNDTITYFLKQTIDSTGCFANDILEVQVWTTPRPALSGDSLLCNDAMAEYITKGNAQNTYKWNVSGGSILAGGGSNGAIIQWNKADTNLIELIETSPNNCSDTAYHEVIVIANPVASFSVDGGCVLQDIKFEDLSTTSDSRKWTFGDGNSATKRKPINNYLSSGDYTIKLLAGNQGMCYDSVEQDITIVEAPLASFDAGDTHCEGQEIVFDNRSVNADNYSWDFGDGNNSSQDQATHTYASANRYDVKLVAANSGCKDSAYFSLDVKESPEASFTLKVEGNKVTATADEDAETYEWDFKDGSTADTKSAVNEYDIEQGWAVVQLTVTNDEGCSTTRTDSIQVDVIGIPELPIGVNSLSIYPNPFTEQTRVELDLAKSGSLGITLFDISGNEVGIVRQANDVSGKVLLDINAGELGLKPGVYLIRVIIDNESVIYRNIEMH